MKTKRFIILMTTIILMLATPCFAGSWSKDFGTSFGNSGRSFEYSFQQGVFYKVIAEVRPAGWDPGGKLASIVPVRLIIFDPEGDQLCDSGPHGGIASYSFRPSETGRYEVQVIIGAPLGALGRLTIKWKDQ